MVDSIDQVFVVLKRWLVGLAPGELQPWFSALLSAAAIVGAFAGLFAITTWLERKGLARIQNRIGPNRVGPYGLLQPMADGLKMLTKEDIVPYFADQWIHFLAPVVKVIPVLLAYAVLPVGRNMAPLDLEAGLLFFFAVGSSTEIAVFMAGWGSRNKYSLLGAMRAIAQLISYEVPLVFASLGVVMIAGSLSLTAIVDSQAGYHWGWLARWHVLTPWGLAGFILFMIAATAKTNRSPFDLPEGESEIIAGHMVEYSGFKYALFYLGEYLSLFAISGVGITLFLGGWREPVAFLAWVPSYAWFGAKLLVCIAFFIWLRGTMPRLRADQLMSFAWKFMLPMTLLTVVAAAFWHLSAGWNFPAAGWWRWALCAALIGVPYSLLGRGLMSRQHLGTRTYRFAE
jgi:NADH-quinone oxidoreductase subunit H